MADKTGASSWGAVAMRSGRGGSGCAGQGPRAGIAADSSAPCTALHKGLLRAHPQPVGLNGEW